mgnify:CR=1 FL=1
MNIDKALLTKGNNSEYMVSRVIKFITFGVCDDKKHNFDVWRNLPDNQGLKFLTIFTYFLTAFFYVTLIWRNSPQTVKSIRSKNLYRNKKGKFTL